MLKQILPFLITLLVISTVTAQNNNTASAFFKSGLDFKNKNMFPEALVAFNKAITLNKKYDSAYVEIGIINVKTGKIDSAIFNFNKALAISPKMATALITLGTVYRDSKPNYDSAILCYSSALKTDSTNKVTLYSIAWCYNSKGEYENTIPYAIKALEIDNTYRPAYAELGHAYRRTQKYTEAIEQFKKNIAISPVDLPIFYSGMCYTELKDKEGALRQYDELKKINEKMAESLKKIIDKMQ